MRALIDTNIFVYASFSGFPQFAQARDFLKSCFQSADSWYLSWSVIYEYLRVVTHRQLVDQTLSFPQALENVFKFTASPAVTILQETSDHPKHLEELGRENSHLSGNIVHDVHLVILMREHDLNTIYTADSDFHRFKKIKVINPLH